MILNHELVYQTTAMKLKDFITNLMQESKTLTFNPKSASFSGERGKKRRKRKKPYVGHYIGYIKKSIVKLNKIRNKKKNSNPLMI